MKIVQLLLRPTVGGAESLVLGLSAAFEARGVQCRTAYLDQDDTTQGPVARLARLTADLRRIRPDVVLAHSALPIVFAGAVPLPLVIVNVLHSAGDDYTDVKLRSIHGVIGRRARMTVAVSQPQADRYLSRFPWASGSLRVIENGVDTSQFAPADSRPPGPITFLTATRLVPWKRVETAIRACNELSKVQDAPLRLLIAGSGEPSYERRLRALALEARNSKLSIEFLGSRDDMAPIMRSVDALLHCSEREGFSVALVEAAASGLPIFISTDVDALPKHAILRTFDGGNAKSLTEVLESNLPSLGMLLNEAAEASRTVREYYSIERVADRYLDLIDAIVKRHELSSG